MGKLLRMRVCVDAFDDRCDTTTTTRVRAAMCGSPLGVRPCWHSAAALQRLVRGSAPHDACVCVCVCVCSTGTRAEYAFEDRCYKTIFTRVRAAMFGSPVLARTSVASCSRRLRSAPLTASFAPYPRPNPRTMRAGGRLALVTYVNTPSLFDTSHVPPTPSPKLIESTSWLVATFAVVC